MGDWNTIECPYSHRRLNQIYWNEGKSTIEIAQMAASLLGREKLSYSVVLRWLREAGISVRSWKEASRLSNSKSETKHKIAIINRQRYAEAINQGRMYSDGRHPNTLAAVRKTASQSHREASETRRCVICGKLVTRPKSKFRRTPERTTCGNRICGGKLGRSEQSLPIRETRLCACCGKGVTRKPSGFRFPPDKTFCSFSCRQKIVMSRRDPQPPTPEPGGDVV